jgi:hypothetical protein
LFAPAATVGINVVSRQLAEDWPPFGHVIAAASAVLILGGLAASVFALGCIPKHGRRGILWQALGGLGLNSLAVAGLAWVFVLATRGSLPMPGDFDYQQRLAGKWVKEHNGVATALELQKEGSFRFVLSGASIADFSGKWSVQNRRLYLNVESIVEGNAERIGKRIHWSIDKLEPNELVLGASNGQDRYERKPPNE